MTEAKTLTVSCGGQEFKIDPTGRVEFYLKELRNINPSVPFQLALPYPNVFKVLLEFGESFASEHDKAVKMITPQNVYVLRAMALELGFSELIRDADAYITSNRDAVIKAINELSSTTVDTRHAEEILASNIEDVLKRQDVRALPVPVLMRVLVRGIEQARANDDSHIDESALCDIILDVINRSKPEDGATILLHLVDLEKLPLDKLTEITRCKKAHEVTTTSMTFGAACAIVQNAIRKEEVIQAQSRMIDDMRAQIAELRRDLATLKDEVRRGGGLRPAERVQITTEVDFLPDRDTDIIQWLLDIGTPFSRHLRIRSSSNDVRELFNPNTTSGYRSGDAAGAWVQADFPKALTVTGFAVKSGLVQFPRSFMVTFKGRKGEDLHVARVVNQEALVGQNHLWKWESEAPITGVVCVRITATGQNWAGTHTLSLGGFELFSTEHPDGVFKALWKDGADPWTEFEAHARDFDGSRLAKGASVGAIVTDNSPGQWIELEFLAGRANVTGYRIAFVPGHEPKGWKVIGSVDSKAPMDSWTRIDTQNSLESPPQPQTYTVHSGDQFKYIRIVMTDGAFDGSNSLQVLQFEVFGNYDLTLR